MGTYATLGGNVLKEADGLSIDGKTYTVQKIKGAVDQLNDMVNAWEALPGGRQVNNRDVEAWLAKDMAPAINNIRAFLGRPKPEVK